MTGAEQGPLRRPFLTVNNKLMGTGGLRSRPRTPSTTGVATCAAWFAAMVTCAAIRSAWGIQQFRLALVDEEALGRTRDCLGTFGIVTTERTFAEAHESGRPLGRYVCLGWLGGSDPAPDRLARAPTPEWRRASWPGSSTPRAATAGECAASPIPTRRSSAARPRHWRSSASTTCRTPPGRPNGLVVRTAARRPRRGAQVFSHHRPGDQQEESIDGVALKSDAELEVTEIRALGIEVPMYDITTGTGDFIANGVVSHNCFAQFAHLSRPGRRPGLRLQGGRQGQRPRVLRKTLTSSRWAGEHIAMGTNVDCYQRAEGRYQLMRGIISALRDHANPFSILTKGTLILRDLACSPRRPRSPTWA